MVKVKLNRIRELMRENKDTQADLAGYLGVSKQLINMKLMDKSAISIKMLGAIAHKYKTTTTDLIEE